MSKAHAQVTNNTTRKDGLGSEKREMSEEMSITGNVFVWSRDGERSM